MSRVFKTIMHVFLSNVVAAVLGYLFTVIIARKLSVEDFGKVSLLISYIYICATIADLGMTTTVVSLSNKCEEENKHNVLAYFNWLFLRLFGFLLPLILLLIGVITVVEEFGLLEFITLFVSYISFLFFRYMQSVQQAEGKWLIYNIGNILNNLLKVVILAIPLLLYSNISQMDVMYSYLIYSVLLLGGGLIWIWSFGVKNNYKNDDVLNHHIRKHLCFIGLSNIIVIFIMRLDLLFINYYMNAQAVGLYSAANSLALIIPLFTNAVMNVLLKYIPDAKMEYLKRLRDLQKKYIPYMLLLILIVCLLSPYIVHFIYGERYQESSMIFALLGVVYLLSVLFTPLEAFFYSEQPRYILYMRIIQLLILLIGLFFFIERWGLYAVVVSVFLSRVINWGVLIIRTNRILRT